MKIDIGTEGKILGTKKVSPNGQVSGLSEYAGEEVLIIYPGPREPRIRMQAGDYVHEVEKAVQGQMKVAFQQYKALKGKYKDEAAATREFITTTEGYRETAEVRRRYFSEPYPAATGVIVAGLLRPGVVIELEAVAALPQ